MNTMNPQNGQQEVSQVRQESPLLRAVQWISITLVLSVILPTIYLLAPDRRDEILPWLYACEWLLLPFVALLRTLVWKTKGLGLYLLSSLAVLCAATLLALCLGIPLLGEQLARVYAGSIFLELLFVAVDSDDIRRNLVRRKKARMQNDAQWVSEPSLLEEPSYSFLWVFLLSYLMGLGTKSPFLCDVNCLSAFFFLPLCIACQYHKATHKYLDTMHSISNIPLFRIRTVGRASLAVLIGLLVLFMLPSLFTRSLRQYGDLREWHIELPEKPRPRTWFHIDSTSLPRGIPSELPQKGTRGHTPEWLNLLFDIFLLLAILYLLRLALRVLLKRFQEFSSSYDEGDIIVTLSKEESQTRLAPLKREPVPRNERERIRRQYRKTIRRHRSTRPAPQEMPIDIETKAGIAHTPEGQALHRLYEGARYGETTEELE